jgi:hypothetical protein
MFVGQSEAQGDCFGREDIRPNEKGTGICSDPYSRLNPIVNQAKKKSNAPGATSQAAPNVVLIEIDDESDNEPLKQGKRGPKSPKRDHFSPPVAVKINGDKRWSFKCQHTGCTTFVSI